MYLRRLKPIDAILMLEWMHDLSVTKDLHTDFSQKTIVDCERFIETSLCDKSNLHLAVADERDTYMGTVSLKNIIEDSAEFAIVVRKCAMGKGFSKYAMTEMLKIGMEELGLQKIYWYVSPDNKRALRFYDKSGYQRMDIETVERIAKIKSDIFTPNYIWYCVKKAIVS